MKGEPQEAKIDIRNITQSMSASQQKTVALFDGFFDMTKDLFE